MSFRSWVIPEQIVRNADKVEAVKQSVRNNQNISTRTHFSSNFILPYCLRMKLIFWLNGFVNKKATEFA